MKPIVAILGLVVAAAAGAVGGIVASSTAAPAPVEVAAHSPAAKIETSAPAASVPIDNANFEKELRDLSDEVLRLRAELAAVREGRVREAAVAGTPTKAGEEIPAESLAILHKDAILRVIAEDRAEQQRKEEDARKQQQMELALQRAERVGKELNLSKAEQEKLAEVYAMEREKRDEFMSKMRQGDVPDREQMRQSFQEYRDWRTTELTNRLGADLATRVNEYDGDRMGFGGRMFGGPDGGGGGAAGPGGGNTGGGGRRNRPGGGNNNGGNNAGGGQGGG